jgi:cysteine desulfurase
MHYLDHNATSPLRPEARAAMEDALAIAGNPSSVHGAGRAARALIEDAREQVAAIAGAKPEDVIFTSGGTEANFTALRGAVEGARDSGQPVRRLFVSAIEHQSVLATAGSLAEQVPGLRVESIPVSEKGRIELAATRWREGKGRALIAVMAANNETGVVQPVEEIDDLLFVDAVQMPGVYENAAYLSLSAHKLGGPQGVGALIVRDGAPFAPQFRGGGQERGLRAGTENVIGIAGFGAAASVWRSIAPTLRDRFEAGLPRCAVVFGKDVTRLGHTSCFALPGVPAETALMALDLDGVMASSGSACSSGKVSPSHVLKAMGVDDGIARCALRVSFGWNSSEADVDAALRSLSKLVERVRAREAA